MYITTESKIEVQALVTDGSTYSGGDDFFFMKKNEMGITQYAGYYGGNVNDELNMIISDGNSFWISGRTRGDFLGVKILLGKGEMLGQGL